MKKELLNYLEQLKNQCYPRLTKCGVELSRQLHAELLKQKENYKSQPKAFEYDIIIPIMVYLLQSETSREVAHRIFSISLQLIVTEPFQLEESVKLWNTLVGKSWSSEYITKYLEQRYQKALAPFALAELFKKDFIFQKNSIKALTYERYITWKPIIIILIKLYYKSIYEISVILNLLEIKQQTSQEQKLFFMEQEYINKYFEIENTLSWLPKRFHLDVMIPVPVPVLRKRGFFNKNASKAMERPEHSNNPRYQFNGGLL